MKKLLAFILVLSMVFAVAAVSAVAEEKKEIRVVNDQIGSPTYTQDLARVICDLLPTEKYGIYHVRNEGFMSWFDFAAMIMEKAGLPCRVLPVSSAEYPTPARRPLNSRLDGSRLAEAGIKPMPSVEDALTRYLDEIRDEINP